MLQAGAGREDPGGAASATCTGRQGRTAGPTLLDFTCPGWAVPFLLVLWFSEAWVQRRLQHDLFVAFSVFYVKGRARKRSHKRTGMCLVR